MRLTHVWKQLNRRALRRAFFGGAVLGLGLLAGGSTAQAQYLGTNFVTLDADGATASATGHASGTNATASGDNSTAVGNNASATGANSSAFGFDSVASGDNASAFGHSAQATGLDSTAVGQGSLASGEGSSAFGQGSRATGLRSSAYGNFAEASGEDATAVGANSSATFNNSTAIGAFATTTRDNQIALGTASNTYTAAGITSAASAAAQTGPTQLVTSDSDGNLATATPDQVIAGSSVFQGLQSQVDTNTEGVAMALAMAGTGSILPVDTNYSVAANIGIFEGTTAFAIGGVARLSDYVFLNGGVGVGTTQGAVGGRAGVTYAW